MQSTEQVSTPKPATLEEIWRDYHRTRDRSHLDLLTEEYLPLVRQIASLRAARLPRRVDVDDLVQEGTLGLRKAIAAFDPGRKVKFRTFAGSYIYGAMLDSLRDYEWTPRLALERAKLVGQTVDLFRAMNGRSPTDAEVEETLLRSGRSPEVVQRIIRDARLVKQTSLSAPHSPSGDGQGPSLGETVAAPAVIARASQLRELKELIASGKLSRTERLLLVLYYAEEMTMSEIGAALDISESRVSQIHTELIGRLRAEMRRSEGPRAVVGIDVDRLEKLMVERAVV